MQRYEVVDFITQSSLCNFLETLGPGMGQYKKVGDISTDGQKFM